jgi:hypothetical protein
LLAVVLCVACGDDGDTRDQTLGQLGADGLAKFCADVNARFLHLETGYVAATCTQMAFADPSTCAAVRQQCIDTTNPNGALSSKSDFACMGGSMGLVDTCPDMTLAEYDDCAGDILDGVDELTKELTCSADLAKLKPPTTPLSCTKLGDRCTLFSQFNLSNVQ